MSSGEGEGIAGRRGDAREVVVSLVVGLVLGFGWQTKGAVVWQRGALLSTLILH